MIRKLKKCCSSPPLLVPIVKLQWTYPIVLQQLYSFEINTMEETHFVHTETQARDRVHAGYTRLLKG